MVARVKCRMDRLDKLREAAIGFVLPRLRRTLIVLDQIRLKAIGEATLTRLIIFLAVNGNVLETNPDVNLWPSVSLKPVKQCVKPKVLNPLIRNYTLALNRKPSKNLIAGHLPTRLLGL